MKISLSENQWIDSSGRPLAAGRVTVLLHDSDTPADIFTLEGNAFVAKQNPFVLDDGGRSESTWFDAGIVDVRLERYNGVPGSYSLVDTYSDGFAPSGARNDTVVYGMAGLADADTALGTVTVVGYNSAHDCGERTFVWDDSCTVAPDVGAIVSSNWTVTGRWILLSESREMPSTWYGIAAGEDESNVSAFLTYPSRVGQWNIPLPPVPRFLPGNYSVAGTFSTQKDIMFDSGAKFANATFQCRSAEVAPSSDYVADFRFSAQDMAHSAWFRTVGSFWQCGALELFQDATNHFATTAVNSTFTVSKARISGRPISYTGTGLMTLSGCLPEDRSLSTAWNLKFTGMTFTDRWFADSGWDFGTWPSHRTWCADSDNTILLSNFDSADVFELLVASAPNSRTSIDLEGRSVQLVDSWMPFIHLSNGTVGILKLSHDAQLTGLTVNDLQMDSWTATFTAYRCALHVTKALAGTISFRDSNVWLGYPVSTANTAFEAEGSTIDLTSASITRPNAPGGKGGGVTLRRCRLLNGTVDGAVMTVQDCVLSGTSVRLVPYMESSAWHIAGVFERNSFVGACALSILSSLDLASGASVKDCIVDRLDIVDNSFVTTLPYGVYMPFWAEDMQHRFVSGCVASMQWTGDFGATWGIAFHYLGNTGNCPAVFGTSATLGRLGSTRLFTADFTPDGGWELSAWSGTPLMQVFCLPVTPGDYGADSGGTWVIGDRAKAVAPYRATAVGGQHGFFALPFHMYVPVCAIDPSQPNYMFSVLLMADETYNGMAVMPVAGEA
jgi:hypothetical protein